MFKKVFYITFLILICTFLIWRFIRPLNIFVIDEKFEKPIHVDIPQGLSSISAEDCGLCHEEIYEEWSQSMHAMAWSDPYFQVDFTYDGSLQICLNCHTPLENQQENLILGFKDKEKFKPILEPNLDFDTELRNEGVTCAVCHIRNGTIVGPFGADNAPHPVMVDSEMYSGMKPCERCHVVSGKRWDTFYRIPPCGTVAEIIEGGKETDCIGCHMPEVTASKNKDMRRKKRRSHLIYGGHNPQSVKSSLKVEYKKKINRDKNTYEFEFILTNVGTNHYLPTGIPNRHLTLELRLLDKEEKLIKGKIFKLKRSILWRPFIIDIKDTRLAYEKPRKYKYKFKLDSKNSPAKLDVTVRYHLLEEKRRKKIGYENKEPIAYSIYRKMIFLQF